MVMNFNPLLSKRAADIFNVKNFDFFSKEVGDKLIPVVPIIECSNIVRAGLCINATSQAIYTTPTDKDFYLTAATLSLIKDATSPSTYSILSCYVNGASYNIFSLPCLASTAQTLSISNSFPFPIKVDRGTAITIFNQSATANHTSAANITGYISETSPL